MSAERAAELRALFDRSFAEALAPAAAPHADLLLVRVAGEPHALVLAEIASFHGDLHVVPLPSPAPELLGVAAVRGAVVPVYDLRALLGAVAASASPPRWLVVARGAPPMAFAFDGFDGHARVDAAAARGTQALAIAGRMHHVVDLQSIRSNIHTRWDRNKQP